MTQNSIIYIFIAGFLLASCSKIRKITDTVVKPTARELYQRQFSANDANYVQWKLAYKAAFGDNISISSPYVEKGIFNTTELHTYSYIISASEGEVISVEVLRDSLQQLVFIDLLHDTNPQQPPLSVNEPNQRSIDYVVSTSGNFRIIVQPELAASSAFTILVSKKPALGFPVAGKGNAAIQSFWGYERDGGQRSHEGIDIFAARNTPVVAASNGIITRTGDTGLGGKQVWQRSKDLGHSLYYAHLDSISAIAGSNVKRGDTVGFMGNTGNAKGGAPHLHFGIYKSYSGAVDPLPFVYTQPLANADSFRKLLSGPGFKTKSIATLRQSPTTKASKIGMLPSNDTIKLLGQHHDWFHIETSKKQKAFIHSSLLTELK